MKANRTELSDIFGAAKTTVDTWRQNGCPFESGGGKRVPLIFDTVNVFKWLLNSSNKSGHDVTQLLDEEKYRKLKRENDIEENLVAPVSLITDVLAQAATQIIPILDSLPMEMKRDNPNLTGRDIQLVKKSIAKCRNLIADTKIELDDD
jgi:phage terminase Nu1 subunit (DNA packaging protein)